jgi:hypothetical protein
LRRGPPGRLARSFFGREREAVVLWERMQARKLLAVIGPAGAGKTSFLRAGVIPARPSGWAAVACTPCTAPWRALGQALAPTLAGDPEAVSELAGLVDTDVAFRLLARWQWASDHALLVVDQFEELFTLNSREAQGAFADLLGRLAAEADIHVLLALRDDLLMRCHEHRALDAIFTGMTPLGALTPDGQRRAVIEPAAPCSAIRRQGTMCCGCARGACRRARSVSSAASTGRALPARRAPSTPRDRAGCSRGAAASGIGRSARGRPQTAWWPSTSATSS